MKSSLYIIVLVAILCFSLSAPAGDWPRFRGPNADGISTETGINKAWAERQPETLWTFNMSDGGYAGPSVADGKVFIIDHVGDNDVVRALDLNTGKQVWEYAYPEPGRPDYGYARSTPTVDGDKVYTLGRLGTLNCLNAKTGQKIWSRNIVKDFTGQLPKWQLAMSPFIDGNNVILCPGGQNASVVALKKTTGETVWQGGGSDKPGYATPVIATLAGKKQYLIFTGFAITGVDPANGKLLWSHPWKTQHDVNAAAPIQIGPNHVFITSGYGHGCALLKVEPGKVAVEWENKEIVAHFSSSVLVDGIIYGTGDPGFLTCLDPKTGKALWKKDNFEKGGIIVVDGAIIGLDGRGGDLIMAEAKPDGYKELGRIKPLGGQSWTAPVPAQGKLLVRNKSTLACLNLK